MGGFFRSLCYPIFVRPAYCFSWLLVSSAATAISCGQGGSDERPPPPAPVVLDDAMVTEPIECEVLPEVDTSQACASATAKLFERKRTVYFVLDTSGSMDEPVLDGNASKMSASRTALETVVEELGHRIKYGMTTFPGPDSDSFDPNGKLVFGCSAGEEAFPITEGDPIECLNLPPSGPVLSDFKRTLGRLEPIGKTPLAPTISTLTPRLAGLESAISVILVTDGWPNCGTAETCDIDNCGPNLLGLSSGDVVCDDSTNCCDPEEVGELVPSPQVGCVDGDESVRAVETLRAAGVDTYVVGVLGEFDFDVVMNRLAEAGGQPREGDRKYYDVQNVDELTDTIRLIGSRIAQSCSMELTDQPPRANRVNVYFDGEILPADPDNGWTYEEDVITFVGEACDRVRAGDVQDIQVLSGCETIIR